FFIFGLIFVALLLTGNIFFFRFLKKLGHKLPAKDENAEVLQQEEQKNEIIGNIVSTLVTAIGVLIGSISLIGLVFLSSEAIEPQHTLYVIALLLIIPILLLPRLNPALRYTILTIGYAAGMIAIAW